MSKQPINNQTIYLAPQILCTKSNDRIFVVDEINWKTLDLENTYDKILIYKRQVEERFINRAEKLIEEKNYIFIVLMICLSYIEWVQQYKEWKNSRNKSQVFFKQSLKNIIDDKISDTISTLIYTQLRCGLFHNGMTEWKIILRYDFSKAISHENNILKINPRILLELIKKDFENYINNLSRDQDLRNKFNNLYKFE